MSRYTYYHVLYVGMINIMMFVPHLVIRDRFNGAILAMIIAVVWGFMQSYITMACFERFPGLGFPEISNLFFPRWLTIAISLTSGIFIWLPAGIIVIYSYSEMVRMFFYPDMNPYLNLLLMASAAIWGSSRSTRSVQFTLEIIVILCIPLLIMFLFKAIFNENLSFDSIRYVAGYIDKPPSIMSIIASTFLYTGTMSLFVFNRLHPKGFKFRFRWIVPLFGTFFLMVTFFIPIGFHGSVGVQDYVYLWSMTADSMAMEYGFINRVLFVFLLLFTGLSLIFVINTWHSTFLLIRYSINRFVETDEYPSSQINFWMALGAAAISFAYMWFANEERNQLVSEIWLVARFFTEILIIFMMLYFVWRRKKERVCV